MNEALRPDFNTLQCDVRLAEDRSPLPDGTKCILLCGEYAMLHWLDNKVMGRELNELRGTVMAYNGIPTICTYVPQDCADAKAHEAQTNPLSKDYSPDSFGEDDDSDGDEKRITHTKFSNYFFWLKSDVKKAVHILKTGVVPKEPEPKYITAPNSDEAISYLSDHKDKTFYFDMETDYEEQNMQCFSCTFDGRTVYNIPILDCNYRPYYAAAHRIFRALARACWYNEVVAHNGACFDFLVLAMKYRIACNRVYDTMIAMHRCFPDVEKSLGHCTSYWTWQPFHKDEDSRGYLTPEQVRQRMLYCGKDVFTMYLIKQRIDEYAKTIPGLKHSIDTAQSSLIPYLTTTLQGISYAPEEVFARRAENDKAMMQYLRLIKILIGDSGLDEIQSRLKKRSKSPLPSSNKQCCAYFYDILGYPVAAYGKPDQFGKRNPSCAKKAMFKLRLKHDNPVIDLCNLYRITKLETTTPLGFTPWKDDNGKIVKATNEEQHTLQAQTQNVPSLFC